jgi:uncharacterized cupredoxin-like copper-binding protein
MKRTLFALAATAIAAAAFVVIAPFAGARTTATTATTVHVTAKDTLKFTLDKKKARHGKTIFKVVNKGTLTHDFWIAGKKTKMLRHNQTATLTVTLKKGKHPYKCTVPGHAAAGMKGVFTST